MLVHGFTQSGQSWRRMAAELGAGGLSVETPDLSGHGSAPLATGDLASEALRLGTTYGRATYAGYSLGGRVVLHLALERPDLVESLVLFSSTAGIEDPAERAARRDADEALAARLEAGGDEGVPAFIDEWLAGPLFRHLDTDTADRPSRLVNTAAGLASSLRHHGTGTQQPLWGRLGELAMPVVIVVGEDDVKFSALGERLRTGIGQNARLVVVPGAGHAVCFESRALCAGVIAGGGH